MKSTWKLGLSSLLVLSASGAAYAQGGDWPMARRDVQRSALQTMAGDIDVPGIKQAISLGGAPAQWLVADVDGDGQPNVVLVRSGRVVARNFDGGVVWASEALGLDYLVEVQDLDGNGTPEVFAASNQQGFAVLNGANGATLWTPSWTAGDRPGDIFPVSTPSNSSLLYVSNRDNLGGGGARVFDVSGGYASPTMTSQLDLAAHGYWRGAEYAAGDLDGDGTDEIVTLNDDSIIVYDILTGAPKWSSASLDRFPFGRALVSVVDLDGDSMAEIILTANQASTLTSVGRRMVIAGLSGMNIVSQWQEVFDAGGIHSYVTKPYGDIIAGGDLEVATSVYEPGTGWRVLVYPASVSNGDPATVTLNDERLLAVRDVNGDMQADLITISATTDSVLDFGTVRAVSIGAGNTPMELWRYSQATFPAERTNWRLELAPSFLPDASAALVFRDASGDGRPDEVIAAGTATPALMLGANRSALGARFGSGALALATSDGFVARLGNDLSTLNPGAGGAPSALQESNHFAEYLTVGGDAMPLLVTVDGAQRLSAFQADGTRVWTRTEILSGFRGFGPNFLFLDDDRGRVAFHSRAQDGSLDLVLVNAGAGTTLDTFSIGASSAIDPLNAAWPLQSGSGTVSHLLQAIFDAGTRQLEYSTIELATGSVTDPGLSRRLSGGMDPMPSLFDVSGDATSEMIVPQSRNMVVANAATGARMSATAISSLGGVASVHNLAAMGPAEIIYGGGFGVTRLDANLGESWIFDAASRQVLPAVLPAEGRVATARTSSAEISILNAADGNLVTSVVVAGGQTFASVDAATTAGETPGVLADLSAIADLDGGGTPAFLAGSSDGYLYALDSSGALLWSLELRSRVGAPIAADVDGDDISDILVPAADGHVYVIGRAALEAPAAVYDNDGTFLATGPGDELDTLPTSSQVGGNWEAVTDATNYLYQISRDDGFVVVPFTDVGNATSFIESALTLDFGSTYFIRVRAEDRSGSPARVSSETVSDGFTVTDSEAPTAMVVADPTQLWPAGSGQMPEQTAVTATFTDGVELGSYRIFVTTTAGDEVTVLAEGPAQGTSRQVDTTWDGLDAASAAVDPGDYTIVATVQDEGGMSARAETTVFVCGVGLPQCPVVVPDGGMPDGGTPDGGVDDAGPADAGDGDAGAPDAGADDSGMMPGDDASTEGDAMTEPPMMGDDGCGCRVTGLPSDSDELPLALSLLVAAAIVRRRRR